MFKDLHQYFLLKNHFHVPFCRLMLLPSFHPPKVVSQLSSSIFYLPCFSFYVSCIPSFILYLSWSFWDLTSIIFHFPYSKFHVSFSCFLIFCFISSSVPSSYSKFKFRKVANYNNVMLTTEERFETSKKNF